MLKITVFILVCGYVITTDVNTDNWQQICQSIKSDLKHIGTNGANNQTLANNAQANTLTLCAQEQKFYQEKTAAEKSKNLVKVGELYTTSCLPIGYCMYEVDQLARIVKTQAPKLPADDQTPVSTQMDSITQNIEKTLNESDLIGKTAAQLAPANGLGVDEAAKFYNFLQSIKSSG